jgi:hypothetical protein
MVYNAGMNPLTKAYRRLLRLFLLLLALSLALQGCSFPVAFQAATPTATRTTQPSQTAAPTFTHTPSHTPTSTRTLTPTITQTPTITRTPPPTRTPTITRTPTPTLTATYDFPDVTIKVAQAHCRYGPSTGYLHAADLYEGDTGTVRGRNNSATWLYIKFDKLHYFCWIAASVADVQGDVMLVYPTERKLPVSTLYGPPDDVVAVRTGDSVRVSWDRVNMTEDDDRGYMIEAYVCQDERYIFVVVSTYDLFYEFADGPGCSQPSSGLLYTVEKHGYTDPVPIPWPAP